MLRRFVNNTCPFFNTQELPQEEAARGRRKSAKAAKSGGKGKEQASKTSGGRKPKYLNLSTYKVHALADYSATIRLFGTTDNYTTQVVSPSGYPCAFVQILHRESLSIDGSNVFMPAQTKSSLHHKLLSMNNVKKSFKRLPPKLKQQKPLLSNLQLRSTLSL